MKNEVLGSIDALITELKKTNNPTQNYFIDIRDELVLIKSTEREKELLDILSKSSRIMDAGGFNLIQQNAWEKMYNSI